MKIDNPGVQTLSQLTIDTILAMGNRNITGVANLVFNSGVTMYDAPREGSILTDTQKAANDAEKTTASA